VNAPEDGEVNTVTRRVKLGQGLINKGCIKKVLSKFGKYESLNNDTW
jgi:hypothetical protein